MYLTFVSVVYMNGKFADLSKEGGGNKVLGERRGKPKGTCFDSARADLRKNGLSVEQYNTIK